MEGNGAVSTAATVFKEGKLKVDVILVEDGPPKPLFLAAPTEEGSYPVLLFLHGYNVRNVYYSQLLHHIVSHGFIVVAPQFPESQCFCSTEDIKSAAAVTNWLSEGLRSLLPNGVSANLFKLALAGHSRGGHAAFAMALGHARTALKFSALLGVDPVAGFSPAEQAAPPILTYKPSSFHLGIPVSVIGCGLSDQSLSPGGIACAPEGVNHKEFFHECRPPRYYFVVEDYGHSDMLDDDTPEEITSSCKSGGDDRDLLRRSIAGIVVAFLEAYLQGDGRHLQAIVDDPDIAPATLSPVCS